MTLYDNKEKCMKIFKKPPNSKNIRKSFDIPRPPKDYVIMIKKIHLQYTDAY